MHLCNTHVLFGAMYVGETDLTAWLTGILSPRVGAVTPAISEA